MTVEHLIAFNLALVAAIMSPGPAMLVALQTTLGAGRRAGIAIGLGLGTMAAGWTLLALLGLETIFQLAPWAYGIVKAVGAIYLIYIAICMWRGASDPISPQERPQGQNFWRGFLINLLNPKSVLFAAAVLVVVFPSQMSVLDNVIIVANHLLVELTFYTTLAVGMSTPAVSRRYLQAKRYIDRAAAAVLGMLGLRLLLSR